MARRTTIGLATGTLLALALSTTVLAGGWAEVALDSGTTASGEGPTVIGVTLLQHGETPVAWGMVTISGANAATGETVSAEATMDGGGHWSATLAFPSEGTWRLSVQHDELQVVPAAPMTLAVGSAAGASAPAAPATGLAIGLLAFVMAVVGLGAGMLALGTRRRAADDRAVEAPPAVAATR